MATSKYLVEDRHVDPHSCRDGEHDDTPVHRACANDHLDVVKYLVEERNCDVDCRDKYEDTPLHDAALGGRLDIVHYLISKRGCNPMSRGWCGRTSLHNACERGRLDVVKYLMENVKVDSSCRDDMSGATPLQRAAEFGTLDVVRYMIEEQQCDLECRDRNTHTLLHIAALGGRLDILQYLIDERGCDPMCRDQFGSIPLHCACDGGSLDVVRYLIEDVKVDPSCRDDNDTTPLHAAAFFGHLSVVRALVEDYLRDPGVKDKDALTPGNWAENEGHTHITSYLSSIGKTVFTDLRRVLIRKLKRYTRKATPTGAVLGSGTYGSVIELTSAGETVAGKVFRMSSTVQLQAIADKISGELIMMAQLHHPNIVQCKGVSLHVDQPLPVLLMERLMSSLHAYLLHPDSSNLPVERKVSILRDTASGLDYLHSHTPAIIHRDLTAKNVLLDSELKAKIADFGNSRIMDLDPNSSPESLTCLPGTLEYMPPEAQGGGVKYDPSLDVFSFGHLSLFTIIQTPVHPLPSTYHDDSSGEVRARSEVKRRVQFVEAAEQLLSGDWSLVALIKQCLHNSPSQRPHSGELLTRLQEMMTHGGEDNLSSTPADIQSPSHERGPVGADSKSDNSHTEKSNLTATASSSSQIRKRRNGKQSPDPPAKRPRCSSPSMPKLIDLEIPEGVGDKYYKFGIKLLADKTGSQMGIIESDCREKVEKILQRILREWLEGKGLPVTWESLIQTLRDIRLSVLADKIETSKM